MQHPHRLLLQSNTQAVQSLGCAQRNLSSCSVTQPIPLRLGDKVTLCGTSHCISLPYSIRQPVASLTQRTPLPANLLSAAPSRKHCRCKCRSRAPAQNVLPWSRGESQSKPRVKLVCPKPSQTIRRRAAAISGWDRPLLIPSA